MSGVGRRYWAMTSRARDTSAIVGSRTPESGSISGNGEAAATLDSVRSSRVADGPTSISPCGGDGIRRHFASRHGAKCPHTHPTIPINGGFVTGDHECTYTSRSIRAAFVTDGHGDES